MKTVEQVEAENRRKYSGEAYDARTICRPASGDGDDYASRMLRLKLEMVARECPGDVIVDLCCGAGEHLESTSRGRALAVGVDFSVPFLRHAEERRRSREEEEQEGGTIAFVCGNARSIPLADDSADALYSLSSLYYMPKLDEIIGEIARVLRPGGRCVLDLGGKPSLNSIVCAAYPELAVSCHVPVGEMLDACRSHGLEVIEHRRFQLLPMWGDRPWWLKPVLQPSWTRLLAIRVAGRMIDEWVSSLPIVRRFVFRHVLLCEKAGVQRQQS